MELKCIYWLCAQMDALISHSSKSYYACVGESTHAYQSPSKDLTAINNRLNGYALYIVYTLEIYQCYQTRQCSYFNFVSIFSNRKVRALNFDEPDEGLVSDSMVANSLYLQNGSCASSLGVPLKTEQPDAWIQFNVVYILLGLLFYTLSSSYFSWFLRQGGGLYERWDCRMPPLPSLYFFVYVRYLVQNVGLLIYYY